MEIFKLLNNFKYIHASDERAMQQLKLDTVINIHKHTTQYVEMN